MRDLAKLDIHCHLEGAFRVSTLQALYAREGLAVESDRLSLNGRVAGFRDWFDIFIKGIEAIKTQDDLARLTYDCVQDAYLDGIIYRSLRYAPYFIEAFSPLSKEQAIEAVIEGQRQAANDFPVHTELIMIAQQSDGEEAAFHIVRLADQYNHVAVDIAGAVDNHPLSMYVEPMHFAKEKGLHITIHAGEFEGAESVRVAIEELGAERIGHGFRSTEDPDVLALAVERNMHMEANISSNLQTGVVSRAEAHPFRQMIAAGLPVSINTDDPAIQGTTLTHDYEMLVRKGLLTKDDLYQANLHAVDAAFTSDDVKAQLRDKVHESYK